MQNLRLSLTFNLVLIAIICSSTFTMDAQRPIRRTDTARAQTDQELITLKDRLWYGGNVMLGFQQGGGGFVGPPTSLFAIGLAPMVGYKLSPQFSVGPRLEFIYTYYKIQTGPNTAESFNLYSGGVGPFARFKIFNVLFLHGEYQYEWAQNINQFGTRINSTFHNLFVGAGYNAGGGEIYVLYNLLQNSVGTLELPFTFRFGFTINF